MFLILQLTPDTPDVFQQLGTGEPLQDRNIKVVGQIERIQLCFYLQQITKRDLFPVKGHIDIRPVLLGSFCARSIQNGTLHLVVFLKDTPDGGEG